MLSWSATPTVGSTGSIRRDWPKPFERNSSRKSVVVAVRSALETDATVSAVAKQFDTSLPTIMRIRMAGRLDTPMDERKRWLNAEDTSAYVGVQVDKLRRYVRSGKLPQPSYHRGPNSPRWDGLALDALFSPTEVPQDIDQIVEQLAGRCDDRRSPGKVPSVSGRSELLARTALTVDAQKDR